MTTGLKGALEALPQVTSVDDLKVEDNIIKYISLETGPLAKVAIRRLEVNDAPRLFDFYRSGLSEKPRWLFAPYPLFHTPPASGEELARRIGDWKSEADWTALYLAKNEAIIGFGLLKRFTSEQVTSAIVIGDDFLQKGLGHLLQTVIVEQARLLQLKGFHVKIVSDNLASLKLHEKCGFRLTRVLPPGVYKEMFEYLSEMDKRNGMEVVDRKLVEMIIELEP